VEQSPGVVEEHCRVGALHSKAEVVHKAFKEGLELLGLGGEVVIEPQCRAGQFGQQVHVV